MNQGWNQQLLEQIAHKFEKYKIVHIDLAVDRTNEQKDYCGDFLFVLSASSSLANVDIRLDKNTKDPINLVLNTSINTIFEKFFVTNTAQAGAWVDLFVGINCKLERMISAAAGGGGGTEYADGAARGSAIGTLVMGDDGTNIQSVKVDADGHLQADILSGGTSGQQYADGAARGTATGNLAMGDDGTNIQSVKVDTDGHVQVDVLSGGGGGGIQYADGAARGTATGNLAMCDDGTNIQSVKGDTDGHLQVDVLSGGGGGARTISESWGSEQTIINAAAVTTGTLSSDVDLKTNGYEGAVVTISATFSTTDDLDIEVLNSNDGSAYDDLTYGMFAIRMPHTDSATKQMSFVIKDLAHFKLNVKRSGATDTITVTAKAMPWRYQSA